MSRCGYSDDLDELALGRWRAQVASALRGKRGQTFLRDLVTALDALPEKQLVANELDDGEGAVCALGALGKHRGVDLDALDEYEHEELGEAFGIAHQLAQETMWINDEWSSRATPEERWRIVRDWALRHLKPETLIGKPELAEE